MRLANHHGPTTPPMPVPMAKKKAIASARISSGNISPAVRLAALAAAEAKKKVTIHARAVFACYASAAAIGARAIWSGLQGRTAQHVAGREEAVVERDWPEDLPAALWQAELTALLPVVTPDGEAPCPTRGGAISSRCSAARRWLGRSRRGRSRRRCRWSDFLAVARLANPHPMLLGSGRDWRRSARSKIKPSRSSIAGRKIDMSDSRPWLPIW